MKRPAEAVKSLESDPGKSMKLTLNKGSLCVVTDVDSNAEAGGVSVGTCQRRASWSSAPKVSNADASDESAEASRNAPPGTSSTQCAPSSKRPEM